MSYEEVREEARALARDAWYKVDANDDGFQAIADAILSHPRIAVLAKDQTHPSSPWPSGCDLAAGFIRGATIMWLDGYRRIVEEP